MAIQRKETNVYLDPDVLRAAQILAVALRRSGDDIIEDAVREYLRANGVTFITPNGEVMGQCAPRSGHSDDAAKQLGNDEPNAARGESDDTPIERVVFPRLTEEEKRRGLQALANIERLNTELLERRGVEKFSPSWELINEARDQRTRELMNTADE